MIGVYCMRDVTAGLDGSAETVAGMLENLLPDARVYCLNQVHSNGIVHAAISLKQTGSSPAIRLMCSVCGLRTACRCCYGTTPPL